MKKNQQTPTYLVDQQFANVQKRFFKKHVYFVWPKTVFSLCENMIDKTLYEQILCQTLGWPEKSTFEDKKKLKLIQPQFNKQYFIIGFCFSFASSNFCDVDKLIRINHLMFVSCLEFIGRQ